MYLQSVITLLVVYLSFPINAVIPDKLIPNKTLVKQQTSLDEFTTREYRNLRDRRYLA